MNWLEGTTALAFVTWLGTIIAVIALVYTWFLARSARDASEAAKIAADTAVKAAKTKISLSNIGFSHSIIASLRKNFRESGGLRQLTRITTCSPEMSRKRFRCSERQATFRGRSR